MVDVSRQSSSRRPFPLSIRRSWKSLLNAAPFNKFVFLITLTLLLYGGLIAIDALFLRPHLIDLFGPTPDLHVYRERTELILNGGIIYLDLPNIEAPPLINYMLTIPQIMGGGAWVYSAYFSTFSLMIALAMYFVLRQWDERLAFISAVLVLISPFGVPESTWGVEDESIAVFTFLVPVLALLHGSKRLSSIALGIGLWTKFLPVFLYPPILMNLKNWKERKKSIAIVALITLAVSTPFLILCPVEYLQFPLYYLLGVKGGGSAGISMWHFLEMGGIFIPSQVGFVATLSAIALAWFYSYKKKLDIWRSSLLVTTAFFAVYPMMHLGYYLIVFAFFSVWATEDYKIALRSFLMYIPLFLAVGFSDNVTGTPFFNSSWGWIAGLVSVALGTAIMIDTSLIVLRKKSFLDRSRKISRAGGSEQEGAQSQHS